MQPSLTPAVARVVFLIFFWGLLGGSAVLFGWLWYAGPADIAADRRFRSAAPCGDGGSQACLTDVDGILVRLHKIELGKTPTAYQVSVRPDDLARPPFTGLVNTSDGEFATLHSGERVGLRYYLGNLTDIRAGALDFPTNANPTEQARGDEDLVQTLEWTVPIPLVPVGAYLLLTRRRRDARSAYLG